MKRLHNLPARVGFEHACPRCGEEFERVEDYRAHVRTCRSRPARIHVVPTADRRWAVLEVS